MTGSDGLPDWVQVLERGWLSANSILFDGSGQTAVVDTGYVTHAAQTLALIDNALDGRPLGRILNTHLHSDHCGGNAALQERYPDVLTSIPPGEASGIERWDEDVLSYRATEQTCPRFRFDTLLQPGDTVVLGDATWEIIGAPGHDPHSIVLFEPSARILISADALWESGFGVVFPELAGEPSFDEVAATFDVIDQLRPQLVIPGHGRIFNDVAQALATARRRLEGFARNPTKHARHALKVLMKFKLLEVQVSTSEAWMAWLRQTPYLESIRTRFFPALTLDQLITEVLDDLIASGAAIRKDDRILNFG